MIKVILLDIDDTLLDFQGYVKESLREGFREFGLGEYNEGVYTTFTRINTVLWHEIEEGKLTIADLRRVRWNRIFGELGITYDGAVFEDYFRGRLFHSAIRVEGAVELLEHLHGRYILAVASNGPYAQQVNRLKNGGMLDYFAG
ncbi:MAG: HAD hydrolase-like protein, partial [Clostridia bacterium]|nr:HAD hydrolase-like protein [Clostridia bacterium]